MVTLASPNSRVTTEDASQPQSARQTTAPTSAVKRDELPAIQQPFEEGAFPRATGFRGGVELSPRETAQVEREELYLSTHKQSAALKERYADPRSQLAAVTQILNEVAREYGIEPNRPPSTILGKTFTEARAELTQALDQSIDKLFADDRGGALTVDKRKIVKDETHQYLEHLDEAIKLGQVSPNVKASDVYRLIESNILALRLQETAALENALGDHGVRHLIDHNINVCEVLADQLKEQGVKITALDRLILHQAMIDHDLGYAMGSVRDPINRDGIKGQDAGHNVLAAQYLRQWGAEANSPLAAVFDARAREIIHHAILYHDKGLTGKPEIILSTDPNVHKSVTLTSIVQVADNTAAFSQKLAGVLYEVPETLEYMRLLKTAHELQDTAAATKIREQLVEHIGRMDGLSDADRRALQQSARMLPAEGYKFSVPRLCGNEATYTATRGADGNVRIGISVQESNIHQQMVSLFEVQQLDQLNKFVKDLTGQKVDLSKQPDVDTVNTPELSISVRKGSERDSVIRDRFEEKVVSIIVDPRLRTFSQTDATLAKLHAPIDRLVDLASKPDVPESTFRAEASSYVSADFANTAPIADIVKDLQSRSLAIKEQRRQVLEEYLAVAT